MASQQQPSLVLLNCPPEVLELVVAHMPASCRAQLRTVCRPFMQAVDSVASQLCLSPDALGAITRRSLMSVAPDVLSLDSPGGQCTKSQSDKLNAAKDSNPSTFTLQQPYHSIGDLPELLTSYLASRMPRLTALRITQGCLTGRQIAQATALAARITHLQLLSTDLTQADLPSLAAAFTGLQRLHLDLPSNNLSSAITTLSSLSQLPALTSLSLCPAPPPPTSHPAQHPPTPTHTPAHALPHAAAFLPLPSLHHLTLHHLSPTAPDPTTNPFAPLAAALPALRSLCLFPPGLGPTKVDLTPLAALTALQTNIIHADTIHTILTALTNLAVFHIDFHTPHEHHGCPQIDFIPLFNVAAPFAHPHLATMTLPPDLLPIHLTTLTSLTIQQATALHPAGGVALAGHAIPLLHALSASACLPTLRSLSLLTTSNDPAPTVCTLFSRLVAITHLQLAHNNWSSVMLDSLAACTTLRRLLLSGNTRTAGPTTLQQRLQQLPLQLPHLEACHWCISTATMPRACPASGALLTKAASSPAPLPSNDEASQAGASLTGVPSWPPTSSTMAALPTSSIIKMGEGMGGSRAPVARSAGPQAADAGAGTGAGAGEVLRGMVCHGPVSLQLEMEGVECVGGELPEADMSYFYVDMDFQHLWDTDAAFGDLLWGDGDW